MFHSINKYLVNKIFFIIIEKRLRGPDLARGP